MPNKSHSIVILDHKSKSRNKQYLIQLRGGNGKKRMSSVEGLTYPNAVRALLDLMSFSGGQHQEKLVKDGTKGKRFLSNGWAGKVFVDRSKKSKRK